MWPPVGSLVQPAIRPSHPHTPPVFPVCRALSQPSGNPNPFLRSCCAVYGGWMGRTKSSFSCASLPLLPILLMTERTQPVILFLFQLTKGATTSAVAVGIRNAQARGLDICRYGTKHRQIDAGAGRGTFRTYMDQFQSSSEMICARQRRLGDQQCEIP